MRGYLKFLLVGLVLGLLTEVQLKLIAGINPPAFIVAVFAYPVLVTLSYAGSRAINQLVSSTWTGDLLHYMIAGIGGLAFEWVLLGNGPGSNAFQPGMFAMWTTFCFGPRVLTREVPELDGARRRFWRVFATAAVLLAAIVLVAPNPNAKVVLSVIGLSASYIAWSMWLLILGWRSRRPLRIAETVVEV